jgi:DNA-binding NarL/FixJ family response regulator
LQVLDDAAATLLLYGMHIELAFPDGRSHRVHATARPALPDPNTELTAQEWRVARLVACGSKNSEIAASLSVSSKTVETHLTHIFRKLRVRSRTELTRCVMLTERSQPAIL